MTDIRDQPPSEVIAPRGACVVGVTVGLYEIDERGFNGRVI